MLLFSVICFNLIFLHQGYLISAASNPACTELRNPGYGLFINTPFFYYNENTNTCEIFSYTGVGGNSNRFKTLAECQRTCVKTPRTYSCTGWSDPGTSYKNIPAYYYNSERQQCEQFTYTGEGGNSNRYDTLYDCQKNCQMTKRRVYSCTGLYDVGTSYKSISAYYYNTESQTCEEFTYSGEGGNANRYDTLHHCQMNCMPRNNHNNNRLYSCSGLYDVGTSYKSIPAYYFNTQSQTCEEFTYSGEGGNANRYDTLHECQKNCAPKKRTIYTCTGLADPGIGYDQIVAYYYNEDRGQCEDFIYSGKGGNPNNYESLYECQSKCEKPIRNPCNEPADRGMGFQSITAYYYSQYDSKCKKFTYRGHGGNSNRFSSVFECKKQCAPYKKPHSCSEPKDSGFGNFGDNRDTFYYYNRNSQRCEEFMYLGNGGNTNRYVSLLECQLYCDPGSARRYSCDEPGDSGFGNERIQAYFYNQYTERCEAFMYTNRGGNSNRFDKFIDCQILCES